MVTCSHPVLAFDGPVQVRSDLSGPLGFTLTGRGAGENSEMTELAFVCRAPEDVPLLLENVAVHRLGVTQFQLYGSGQEWTFEAAGVHIHRDVTDVFYKAVPPREAPLKKRVFWRVVLSLAPTAFGRALLSRFKR
jgi:hypothetical protein